MASFRYLEGVLVIAVSLGVAIKLLTEVGKSGYCLSAIYLIVSLVLLLVTWIATHMTFILEVPASHSWKSLISQYVGRHACLYFGKKVYDKFIAQCENGVETQSQLLKDIIEQNKDTAYGKYHNFDLISDREKFKETQHLTDYKDLEKWFTRIIDGEQNVTTSKKVVFMAKSSGTTGKCKYIPVTEETTKTTMEYFFQQCYQVSRKLREHNSAILGREAFLYFTSASNDKDSIIPSGPISNHMMKHRAHFLTPKEAFDLTDHDTALHVNAFYMLRERNLTSISTMLSPFVLTFWNYTCKNWTTICEDIRNGRISYISKDEFNMGQVIAINKLLTPDPKRADELMKIYNTNFNKGINITRRIWPRFSKILMLTTGSMKQAAMILKNTYMKGVDQISALHPASESIMGYNLEDGAESQLYTLGINNTYFEFIPESEINKKNPKTIFIDQVEIGKNYEIVITSSIGLYRYRMGDVVKVVNMRGETPIYAYMYRYGEQIAIGLTMMPQTMFTRAIESTLDYFELSLADYTTCEDVLLRQIKDLETVLPHYIIFIELREDAILNDKIRSVIDEKLISYNNDYRRTKDENKSAPCYVYQVSRNTFQELRSVLMSRNSSMQVKPHRRIRETDLLTFLMDKVIYDN